MSGRWRIAPAEKDGEIVWVLYCLRDQRLPDTRANRAYYPKGVRGWFQHERNARRMAEILDKLDQIENAPPGVGPPGDAKKADEHTEQCVIPRSQL